MNKFELFCMIFYVLDAAWDTTRDPQLGNFLSSANPFLFTNVGSADPCIYTEFCDAVPETISLENSYEIASAYIASLADATVEKAFFTIDKDEWIACAKEYLSQAHKGGEPREI